MELPWEDGGCILCLRDDIEMSRSHIVPQSLGGFVWARTHCASCNSLVGSAIEVEDWAKKGTAQRRRGRRPKTEA
jgi:HNH endonuclease